MFIKKMLSGLLLLASVTVTAMAETIALNPNAPDRYVVIKGDTLWDISAKFLRDPWLWPEVWYVNPEISNPHLIYPGDIISLVYDKDGNLQLKIERASSNGALGNATVKLSPEVRESRLDPAITTIPIDAIRQFLTKPRIISKEDYEKAPYIVAFQDQHLIASQNNKAYVRGLTPDFTIGKHFGVYRLGDAYRNPGAKKDEILGYETVPVSDVRLDRLGDPASMLLVQSYRETLVGDRVFPSDDKEYDQHFLPHKPANTVRGSIISVVDGVSRIGQYSVVVVNLGLKDGMEPGHVLAVNQAGESVRDLVSVENKGEQVTLPEERAGLLMIFRPFERLSYALILSAERDIRVYDSVTQP